MSADFLLELRSEEIPARMQAGARAELVKLFRREMDSAGVSVGDVTVWSTPRRLALIARSLPLETEAVSEEAKGPPEGAPDQAVDGFCRKNGVTRDQLEVRDVKGRSTYFAVIETPGRAVKDVLTDAIAAIIRDFSWPKSMRWGDASISTESLRWVRPLSGIVALLDDQIIECEAHGVTSGAVTLGHRFHHSGDITIGNAGDYAVKLRAGHVIVDHEERQAIIRSGAAKAAADAGLDLVEDEGLVIENAGLTEWPVPLLGRFEDDFLEVPPETIQLTARVNQKYFVCEKDGKLANAFICTSNIDAEDPAVVIDGNRKVLAARLSDAKFFWDVDRKKSLAKHAQGLERITFHEKLGTVADKVDRVAKLARWLVEEGIVKDADPDMTEQAARLCKADLVTEMVGEFPELQGLMGGYYARAEGLPDAVADAIRDHYKPIGQGDDVPTAPVTVAVSLADKLDTLSGFFAMGDMPTGSKDPFALRRAALGVIRLLMANTVRIKLHDAELFIINNLLAHYRIDDAIHRRRDVYDWIGEVADIKPKGFKGNYALAEIRGEVEAPLDVGYMYDLLDFFADRLKVQQREAGVRHDLIDAVFALGGEDDLVGLLARVHALQAFMGTEDGTNLLAGYKRAANILKKEGWDANGEPPHTGEEDPLSQVDDPAMKEVVEAQLDAAKKKSLSYAPEAAEKALIEALDEAAPKAAASIRAEDFEGAMTALATLRAPIDAFFGEVTVNDDDPAKRKARLDLLSRFRNAVQQVADFSKIEG
ncbi:glycine--tRNA ligase subunit beta [Altererythrobacter luteolus]|uniref:Glycine--tRNA ligase beta subunit n=1 Tax=Pontixanthobacter luteolus TaxID=295089 RepID=A0A6I4UYM0_9SPHN|nr:glycine--tRNA ligase subunit beta [Pontixanthobacter luteolus]MXP46678.1 glycine--tRNA ligase subunit beta [Pontixanthobacter luteolus]